MPKAETEQDLKNEVEICEIVLAANRARYDGYVKLSAHNYRVDRCFFKKEAWYQVPKLFCECKQRTFPFGQYKDGHVITVGKLIAAKWLKDTTGVPCALFSRFSDGIVAGALLSDHSSNLMLFGRKDRSDIDPVLWDTDIDPCFCIPWNKFKIILDPNAGVA